MVEWKRIKDICSNICSGGTPNTKTREYYNGNIPWLRTQEVDWGNIYDTEIKITQKGIDNSSAKIIEKDCVIVAMYGATAAKVAINKIPLSTNQACCNLKINKNISNYKYVYYWLCKEYHKLKALGEGSQNNISGQKIKDYPIPIPPPSEQQHIVETLDTFTTSIDNLKEQIAQRRKQYEHYRDQLFSFEGRDLEKKKIGELFVFKNGLNKGKAFFGHGTPIVNYTDVYHNRSLTKDSIKGKVELTENEIRRFEVHRGDVFFTRTSETPDEVGYPSVMLDEIDKCTFSGFVLRASPITQLLLPEYCKYCFFTYDVRKNIVRSATYTTRALTNGGVLSKISIPVPPLSEQSHMVSILDSFEASIANLEEQLALRQKQYEYYREKLLTFE